jgi:hypothetical protein
MKTRTLFLTTFPLFYFAAAHAGNIIQNWDFSSGNTNFSSDYLYIPYDYANSNLTAQVAAGDYTVAPYVPPSFGDWSPFYTVSGGSSQMLIVNGSTKASQTVWSQSVQVWTNITYSISFYLAEISIPDSVATNALYLGGNLAGTVIAPSTKDVWQQFSFTWNSGANTNVLVALKDLNTQNNYNDFAIDNIEMSPITPVLALTRAGAGVLLMWPTNATGYTLQFTTNLVSPSSWSSVFPAPVVIGANNEVTNGILGASVFYRLAR